jgi:hypothetical protein
VRRHRQNKGADRINDGWRAIVPGIENADGAHQLLDSDAGVVGLSRGDQYVKEVGCPALHLVDIHAGIEQERLTSDPILTEKREITILAASQRLSRIKPRPSQSGIEIEAGHLRSRVLDRGRSCLEHP